MELTIKTSVIDYLEENENGISVLICISISDFHFQAIYFVSKKGSNFLEAEPNFLKLWGVSETTEIPFYDDLCKDIETLIPSI
jgi:hypothetical protein